MNDEKKTMSTSRNEPAIFLVFLCVLSLGVYGTILTQDSFMKGSKLLGLLLMWVPGIAAVLTRLLGTRDFTSFGWRLGKPTYLLIAYFLPIAYTLVAYLVCLALGIVEFSASRVDLTLVIMVLVTPFINMAGARGEEIGWRGLLLPDLFAKLGFAKTSLCIGAVWAVWHFPLILLTDFYSGNYPLLGLLAFTTYTVGITFAYNWLWLASGSIWTVTLLHATHNLYALNIAVVFEPVGENAEILVSDFGVMVPLTTVLVAIIFWRLGSRLSTPAAS